MFIKRFRDPLYKEDNRSQFHYTRRTSVSRYNGSWKKKYRIHHNWLLGNCSIYDVVSQSTAPLSPDHLQFTHDFVFTAQEGTSTINMWRYQKETTIPYLIRQLQSLEQPDATDITFMKLIDGDSNMKHLIAGYSNGGFTLWQLLTTEVIEVANYIASSTTQIDKVASIGMALPMIILYTEDGKFSVFRINTSINSLELMHQLQSPMNWSPVTIDIHRYPNSKRDLWKAVLCFGLSGGNYTTSVGIQVSSIWEAHHLISMLMPSIGNSALVGRHLVVKAWVCIEFRAHDTVWHCIIDLQQLWQFRKDHRHDLLSTSSYYSARKQHHEALPGDRQQKLVGNFI